MPASTKLPPLTPLDSTWISGFHYEPTTNVLHVGAKNGAVYRIPDVPADKVEAFQGAASPGKFYNDKIRSNHVATKVSG